MVDHTSNGHSSEGFHSDPDSPRADPIRHREPRLVSARLGGRLISLDALVERVVAEFQQEHAGTIELVEASTRAGRLKLILPVVDYVLAVESVQLSLEDRAELVNLAYSSLFGYGPLDSLFEDERITTISLDGHERAAVRYGHGELTPIGTLFDGPDHLQEIIQRLLRDADAELRSDLPAVEVGLTIADRPICLSIISPSVALQLGADIRLHPVQSPTAQSLLDGGFCDERSLDLIRALAASSYGVLIVGDPESGKTTLLDLFASMLPSSTNLCSVERAGELRLPPGATFYRVQWPKGDRPGRTFGDQIMCALEAKPDCLLLDEVRADEPAAIAPLLQGDGVPRQIWSFRSSIFVKRLQSALTMLARRAYPEGGDEPVRKLFDRLPFMLAVNRTMDGLRLWSINEWQYRHGLDTPSLISLMQRDTDGICWTGERPSRVLPLLDEFWT